MITRTVIFSIIITAVAGICCEDNWIRYGESCYLFVGNHQTWMEGDSVCQSHKAELASIQTAAEDSFIKEYLKEFADLGAKMATWVGGTDMEIEGVWRWSNGEKFNYTDWNPGQPDVIGHPSIGDCLLVRPFNTTDHHWADAPCFYQYCYLCEKR